jgi:hypothetical protein
MLIFRYIYCIFQGHAFVEITTTRRPYRYCLHCGKIVEPSSVLKQTRSAHSTESRIF